MTDDVAALYLELLQAQLEGYTAMDRYRDFRAVFLGSDQGKRVLAEILRLGHAFRSAAVQGVYDTNRTFFADGQRTLALMIMDLARLEPKPRPARQGKAAEI